LTSPDELLLLVLPEELLLLVLPEELLELVSPDDEPLAPDELLPPLLLPLPPLLLSPLSEEQA
jgi:hypothetical protein